MGRSVSTPSAATLVAYNCIELDEGSDDCWIIDDYRDHLRWLFHSISSCTYWIGREDFVVGENDHATFGLSEYCGLVAYWAVPKTPLGEAWLRKIEPRYQNAFGGLVKLGTFSNGEGVYERIAS